MKLWVSVFALTLLVGLSAPAQAAFQLVAKDVFEKLSASAESSADVKKACASSKSSNACKTAKSKALFSIYQSNTNALINTMNEESFTAEEYKRINDIQGVWIKELTGKTYSEVLVLQKDRLSLVIDLFNAFERKADQSVKLNAFAQMEEANDALTSKASILAQRTAPKKNISEWEAHKKQLDGFVERVVKKHLNQKESEKLKRIQEEWNYYLQAVQSPKDKISAIKARIARIDKLAKAYASSTDRGKRIIPFNQLETVNNKFGIQLAKVIDAKKGKASLANIGNGDLTDEIVLKLIEAVDFDKKKFSRTGPSKIIDELIDARAATDFRCRFEKFSCIGVEEQTKMAFYADLFPALDGFLKEQMGVRNYRQFASSQKKWLKALEKFAKNKSILTPPLSWELSLLDERLYLMLRAARAFSHKPRGEYKEASLNNIIGNKFAGMPSRCPDDLDLASEKLLSAFDQADANYIASLMWEEEEGKRILSNRFGKLFEAGWLKKVIATQNTPYQCEYSEYGPTSIAGGEIYIDHANYQIQYINGFSPDEAVEKYLK